MNAARFPNLANLVKKYLSITATSVPVERVFSVCSVIVSKLCASGSLSSVDSMILLAKNQVLMAGHLPEDEDEELHVVPAEAVIESDSELSD